jgi:hypothetical protein
MAHSVGEAADGPFDWERPRLATGGLGALAASTAEAPPAPRSPQGSPSRPQSPAAGSAAAPTATTDADVDGEPSNDTESMDVPPRRPPAVEALVVPAAARVHRRVLSSPDLARWHRVTGVHTGTGLVSPTDADLFAVLNTDDDHLGDRPWAEPPAPAPAPVPAPTTTVTPAAPGASTAHAGGQRHRRLSRSRTPSAPSGWTAGGAGRATPMQGAPYAHPSRSGDPPPPPPAPPVG